MANPTLSYGGTTVTLAMPSATKESARNVREDIASRRTLGGLLRVARNNYGYQYKLEFVSDAVATYDSVLALWNTALAAGGFPTLTWSGGPWSTLTAGVQVYVRLSQTQTQFDTTKTDWTLIADEVAAR